MKTFMKSVLACAIGTVFGFALLMFFGIVFLIATASLSSSKMGEASIKDNSILFIPLRGEVVERKGTFFMDWEEDSPFFSGTRRIGLFELQEAIRKAKSDKKIRGIYLKVGGLRCGWASAEAIYRSLLDFKSSGKYIQAYGEYFDEKSYLIASTADKIHIYPEGSFEFNGIAAVPLFAKGTLEKLNIETQIFRAGEFKSAVELFTQEKMSPENRQQTLELVNDLWNHYVQTIAERRQIEAQELNRIASDLDVLRSHQALQHNLADEPASEEQVLELLRTLSDTEKDKKLPLVSFSNYYRSTNQGFGLGKSNRIAVIFASGEIISGRNTDEYVGSEDILMAMRQIAKEKDIKGLVIRVNSPGGSALASDVIWRQTLEVKKTKPVIASFGDIAASGGYYLAAGADHIFAEANTLTGSIGV
ncbi:MAG: signal peptide peptidase SppA, partial [Bdellovibrionales bacterium]|nr:signal peptide peptidase SppA [Bdellovibrionales bacterium]